MANIIHPDIDPNEKFHEKTSRYTSLIARVAMRHSLSSHIIERILLSQFRCIHDVIKTGEFRGVRMPRIGLFRAKQARIVRYFEDIGYWDQTKKIGKQNEPPHHIHRLAMRFDHGDRPKSKKKK